MGRKILIVDDDELVLYGLARALRSESVHVVAVGTAEEALEQIRDCSFDLTLVDIHLADYCGIELMKQIKVACPKIKCIIMTASYRDQYEYSERMRQVAEITGCHFLPKPFDLGQMRDLVLLALKRDDLFRSPQEHRAPTSSSWKSRNAVRRQYREEMMFSVHEHHRDTEGHTIMAVGQDISDEGIGLLSDFVLYKDQILTFPEHLANRQGRVVWSRSNDQGKCRVGVQFT